MLPGSAEETEKSILDLMEHSSRAFPTYPTPFIKAFLSEVGLAVSYERYTRASLQHAQHKGFLKTSLDKLLNQATQSSHLRVILAGENRFVHCSCLLLQNLLRRWITLEAGAG